MKFGQRLSRFHAQPVQVQISRVLAPFKQMLCLDRCFGPDRDQREPEHIHLSGRLRHEEVRDAQPSPFSLPRKCKPQEFFLPFTRHSGLGTSYTTTSFPSPCAGKYPYTTAGSNKPVAATSSCNFFFIGRNFASTSRT